VGSLLGTTDDALGMAEMGNGQQRQRHGERDEDERQRPAAREGSGLNLGFSHLDFLKSGRTP
jgi:hypothetical protein